jgi:hypothetical protein
MSFLFPMVLQEERGPRFPLVNEVEMVSQILDFLMVDQ